MANHEAPTPSEPNRRQTLTKPYFGDRLRQPPSPYHFRSPPYVWFAFAIAMLLPALDDFGPVAGIALALVLVSLAWFTLRPPGGRMRTLRAMHELQARQLWFDGQPVTCRSLPEDEQLDAALEPHSYRRITIDGRSIASYDDLADALQQHTPTAALPSEGRARVLSLLVQINELSPRSALVWRHASDSLAADPSLVATCIADWSVLAPQLRPGLLLFVDVPTGPRPQHEDRPQLTHGTRGPEPDRAILRDAPQGVWWKPQPGELTH